MQTVIPNQSKPSKPEESDDYSLSDQIGYLLRLANQQHLEIFHRHLSDLTPTQFALMATLHKLEEASQNKLGRQIGIDAATTNGVVERLTKKGFLQSRADPADKRRLQLSLNLQGQQKLRESIPVAQTISKETLSSLTPREAQRLLQLLKKMQADS